MTATKAADAALNSRVKENKRRHRLRQKEYVATMEQSIAQTREQGVQATMEVQKAARHVADENRKLKQLLSRIGLGDPIIHRCLNDLERLSDDELRQLVLERLSGRLTDNGELCIPSDSSDLPAKRICGKQDARMSTKPSDGCSAKQSLGRCSPSGVETPVPATNTVSSCASASPGLCSKEQNRGATRKPCQLSSLLTGNPAADVTQIPLPIARHEDPGEYSTLQTQGVECTAAYKMLIPYADTDEKIDVIANALESGCTPSAGGGCSVKTSTIWKVLDEHCL